jgi:hypothetical protein
MTVLSVEAETLREIQGYAGAGRIVYSRHARQRMYERGAFEEDIVCALANATASEAQPPDRWKVSGEDRDGDPLVVILVIESSVVVVTLF